GIRLVVAGRVGEPVALQLGDLRDGRVVLLLQLVPAGGQRHPDLLGLGRTAYGLRRRLGGLGLAGRSLPGGGRLGIGLLAHRRSLGRVTRGDRRCLLGDLGGAVLDDRAGRRCWYGRRRGLGGAGTRRLPVRHLRPRTVCPLVPRRGRTLRRGRLGRRSLGRRSLRRGRLARGGLGRGGLGRGGLGRGFARSEEHTSELQSPYDLVCRLLLEK